MASSGVSKTFVRRLSSLKTPYGEGGSVGNKPFSYDNFMRLKENVYLNSNQPTHLNSRFGTDKKKMIMAVFYTLALVPVGAWIFNTDRNGTKGAKKL